MTPRLLWSATMPKLSLVSMGVILISTFAFAEPIYLDCHIKSPEGIVTAEFSITIDEATSKVTETFKKNNSVETFTGFFSHDTIRYASSVSNKFMVTTFETTINRNTLAMKKSMTNSTKGGTPEKIAETSGACKIIKMQGRKI